MAPIEAGRRLTVTDSGDDDAKDGRMTGVWLGFVRGGCVERARLALAFCVVEQLWLPRRIEGAAIMVDNGVMLHE